MLRRQKSHITVYILCFVVMVRIFPRKYLRIFPRITCACFISGVATGENIFRWLSSGKKLKRTAKGHAFPSCQPLVVRCAHSFHFVCLVHPVRPGLPCDEEGTRERQRATLKPLQPASGTQSPFYKIPRDLPLAGGHLVFGSKNSCLPICWI